MENGVIQGKNALGIRKVYESLVVDKKLTTIFRPYDKKYGELYKVGSIVELRIIERPGSDADQTGPVYTQDKFWVKIIELRSCSIWDLHFTDFTGSSPDVNEIMKLLYHLGMIYNKPAEDLSFRKVVRINFQYINEIDLQQELNQNEQS